MYELLYMSICTGIRFTRITAAVIHGIVEHVDEERSLPCGSGGAMEALRGAGASMDRAYVLYGYYGGGYPGYYPGNYGGGYYPGYYPIRL